MSQFVENLKASFLAESDRVMAILPDMVIGLVGLLIAFFVGNRIKAITRHQLTKRMDDPLLAAFLARLIKVLIVIGGLLFLLKRIGWGDAAAGIMATAGVGAFVIGFALRDIGENFLAGIIMAFQRPFGVGDTIEVAGIQGVIVGLSLRETHVKTFDGKDVFVPNGIILKNPLFNYTVDGFMRKDFEITLPFDADSDKAIELVAKEVSQVSGVLAGSRSPTVTISSVDKVGLKLKVYFWVDTNSTISGSTILKDSIQCSVAILRKNGYDLEFYIKGLGRSDYRTL